MKKVLTKTSIILIAVSILSCRSKELPPDPVPAGIGIPGNSQVYISADYSYTVSAEGTQYTLQNIHYEGLTALPADEQSGSRNMDSGSVEFKFENVLFSAEEQSPEEYLSRAAYWKHNGEQWIQDSETEKASALNSITTLNSCVIVLVLDKSDSLGSDFRTVQSSAREFIDTLYNTFKQHGGDDNEPEGIYLGIVAFSSDINIESLPVARLTNASKEAFKNFVNGLRTSNNTAMRQAMNDGLDMMKLAEIDNVIPRMIDNAYLLTFTDGLDNSSLMTSSENLMARLEGTRIRGERVTSQIIAVKGRDVGSDEFDLTLQRYVSYPVEENYTLADNFSDVQQRFTEMAEGLVVTNNDVNLTCYVPPAFEGKVVWTFDLETDSQTTTVPDQTELLEMVPVSGGVFNMGQPYPQIGSGSADEQPVHEVTLGDFSISRYEITQEEYYDVTGTNPSFFSGSDHPVDSVSWLDAVEFCNLLSIREGLNKVYTINGNLVTADFSAGGYRLPTEAEWEYAARGGSQSSNYEYSGSNQISDVGWSGGADNPTASVGEKSPNELGLYDMTGNVWEWCWDWYDSNYYADSPSYNPTGPDTGMFRVLRGGSRNSASTYCRNTYRGRYPPDDNKVRYLGLRVVR